MAIEATIRKWGNSFGVLLPKNFVERKQLKENDVILIDVVKEADLSDVFGSLKMGMSGQEFKDMVRKGWD